MWFSISVHQIFMMSANITKWICFNITFLWEGGKDKTKKAVSNK